MARETEFLALDDAALRAVIGPNSRHVALIEDAFKVLIEAPGGGVTINGSPKDRAQARRVVQTLSDRADTGAEITEADVRTALGAAVATPRPGQGRTVPDAVALPVGRRGAIAPKTAAQARYLEMLSRCELSFGVGPAGTGKTFLAAAYGASLLRRGQVDRLVITRPAVEAGEKLGFLPGDLNEKVDPYLAPIWEALNDILGVDDVRRRRDKGEIEAAPIAFMRGRTLSHAFIIVDEAQNTSRLQMKMVLTRLGEGARMVVTGDPSQVDLLNPRDSGLGHALRILDGVEGVGMLRFEASDVVRHAMVERIVRAYDADASQQRPRADLEDPDR
ncbi:MAG: PhoH family protein [Brevundimonas sp.]|jgi:phosphate starvation-inducible PhoH-like protein|uniref:PhoH family protein n=1 Tax=Brevundimonas sp. TaxID=1871086 RepID=UPI0017A26FB4|nr:PhoH family protein [Brevundimonas sp.]MBA4805390.1 PhoH family protein [Brevundimonas sp.]